MSTDCFAWANSYFQTAHPLSCGPAYLSTKLEVHHDDGDLGAGDDEDDEHQEQETKQIVILVLPDCLKSIKTHFYCYCLM